MDLKSKTDEPDSSVISDALGAIKWLAGAWLAAEVVIAVALFPYRSDPPRKITSRPDSLNQKFYNQTYAEDDRDLKYVEANRKVGSGSV
jgi:hypothetical protein